MVTVVIVAIACYFCSAAAGTRKTSDVRLASCRAAANMSSTSSESSGPKSVLHLPVRPTRSTSTSSASAATNACTMFCQRTLSFSMSKPSSSRHGPTENQHVSAMVCRRFSVITKCEAQSAWKLRTAKPTHMRLPKLTRRQNTTK